MSTKCEDHTTRKRYVRILWRWVYKWYWLISLFLIVVSLGLGYWGTSIEYARRGEISSVLDVLYQTLKTINLNVGVTSTQVPWPLNISRFLTPILFANAIVVGLASLFQERFNMVRLWTWRNHVIICGFGKKGGLLAKRFRQQGFKVVVIEKDRNNKNWLPLRFHDIIVLWGDATDESLLLRAGIKKARYLFALCSEDGVNAEVAMQARMIASDSRKRPLVCLVHITDLELCHLLQEREIELEGDNPARLEFFNIYESGARILLQRHPLSLPSADTFTPHILIVGPGRLGISLMLLIVREWYATGRGKTNPMRITVVDKSGSARTEALLDKYPHLKTVCTFDVLAIDTHCSEYKQADFLFDSQGHCTVSTAYVCMDTPEVALMAALTLFSRLSHQKQQIPIIVRMSEKKGISSLISNSGTSNFNSCVQSFHLLNETCAPKTLLMSTNELIAQALHADYLEKCTANNDIPDLNSSMVSWECLPENLKESNRHQASQLAERLHTFGYHIVPLTDWDAENYQFTAEEVEAMAIMEHERWCKEKQSSGFSYAPGKKTDATHPDLMPWEDLDEHTREKDRNMVRAAPRILAHIGYQVKQINQLA